METEGGWLLYHTLRRCGASGLRNECSLAKILSLHYIYCFQHRRDIWNWLCVCKQVPFLFCRRDRSVLFPLYLFTLHYHKLAGEVKFDALTVDRQAGASAV